MADWLFRKSQLPQSDINFLMDAFASFGYEHGKPPPFANHTDLHNTIDSIPLGDAPWRSFSAQYTGAVPNEDVPSWMTTTYEVWTRDIRTLARNCLDNPDFKYEFHTAPYREYNVLNRRRYSHLMSGNWAWRQAVSLFNNNVLQVKIFYKYCFNRILSPKTLETKAQCFALSFLEVIKRQSQ